MVEEVRVQRKILTPQGLGEEIAMLSRGRPGGVMIIPLTNWQNIKNAYDSPLIKTTEDISIIAFPIRKAGTSRLDFQCILQEV